MMCKIRNPVTLSVFSPLANLHNPMSNEIFFWFMGRNANTQMPTHKKNGPQKQHLADSTCRGEMDKMGFLTQTKASLKFRHFKKKSYKLNHLSTSAGNTNSSSHLCPLGIKGRKQQSTSKHPMQKMQKKSKIKKVAHTFLYDLSGSGMITFLLEWRNFEVKTLPHQRKCFIVQLSSLCKDAHFERSFALLPPKRHRSTSKSMSWTIFLIKKNPKNKGKKE